MKKYTYIYILNQGKITKTRMSVCKAGSFQTSCPLIQFEGYPTNMFLSILEVFLGTIRLHRKVRRKRKNKELFQMSQLKTLFITLSNPGGLRMLKLIYNLRFNH